jgi:hypothetical protein
VIFSVLESFHIVSYAPKSVSNFRQFIQQSIMLSLVLSQVKFKSIH